MKVFVADIPKPEQDQADVEKLLSHPLVLRSAWWRVKTWYKAGEWSPEAELVSWSLAPDDYLLRLSQELAENTYHPSLFRRIPYPKKGGQLRHYTLPSVKDQVAFAVFGILLAPYFEAWMPNFSFGNRWYRPIYRQRAKTSEEEQLQGELFKETQEPARSTWAQRDFSLNDRRMYQPYPRAYGMFRRVAHWTAAAMLSVEKEKVDTLVTDQPKEAKDYAEGELPRFVHGEWWHGHKANRGNRGYWVHLDLQLAYPSVRRSYLKSVLGELCSINPVTCEPLREFGVTGEPKLAGYPRDVSEPLSRSAVRRLLIERLFSHLEQIDYRDFDPARPERGDALWIPPHSHSALPRNGHEPDGLPTGLAISGLLMNVYLSGFDLGIGRWIKQANSDTPAAFLRFADDMIFVTPEPEFLLKGIDRIWDSLCHPILTQRDDRKETFLSQPADSGGTTNLRVSWAKVEPSAVSMLLQKYLKDHNWSPCDGCKRHCPPPADHQSPRSLLDWFQGQEPETQSTLLQALRKDALRPDRLEPFVTFLVERLSGLGRDSLLDRFGQSASQRLTQLHEMVRLNIADQQVKEDTRLSFAVNRLVRAWIAEDEITEGRQQLIQIRRSVEVALSKAPWKFSLWRAAVQAAARRPLPQADPRRNSKAQERYLKSASQEAVQWLTKLLQSIAHHQPDGERSEDGLDLDWNEEDGLDQCWENHAHPDLKQINHTEVIAYRREVMLSTLRTSFWRALASVVREISALDAKLHCNDESQPQAWSSHSWTFRAFSEDQIHEVLHMLTSVNDWIEVLYPEQSRESLSEHLRGWWWEIEALTHAALACTPRGILLNFLEQRSDSHEWFATKSGSSDSFEIELETLSLNPRASLAHEVIRHGLPPGNEGEMLSNPWLHLILAQRTGEDTEEESIARAIVYHAPDPSLTDEPFGLLGSQLALSRVFRIEDRLPDAFCRRLRLDCERILSELARHDLAMPRFRLLRIYEHARQVALSLPDRPPAQVLRRHSTLHRILWADPAAKSVRKWPEPAASPAIGLPTRIALAMLVGALEKGAGLSTTSHPMSHNSLPELPVWCFSKTTLDMLSIGRSLQLGIEKDLPLKPGLFNAKSFELKRGIGAWEVPPHATFYLPWVLGWIHSVDIQDIWTHILLFQTAVDGTERSLDVTLDYGIGSVPLVERWNLRSRVPVPEEVWKELDNLTKLFGFRSENDRNDTAQAQEFVGPMIASLNKVIAQQPVSSDDFLWERIDVRLELTNSFEVPYGISPFMGQPKQNLPFRERFELDEDKLADSFTVRIGQVRIAPNWSELPSRFPRLRRAEIQGMMKEVTEVLGPDSDSGDFDDESQNDETSLPGPTSKPALVVLPEISIPRSEIRTLIRVSEQQETAIFAGLLWRALPAAVRPHRRARRTHWIANEGLLVTPLKVQNDRGPAIARHFYIEKPIPAHSEHALAKALSDESGEHWRMLSGRRWYRFVHPSWGDFTVAICSDLINSSPWAALRGEILHLIMCAYNKDVSLYEALTWTRAYENYVNVVGVNHGEYGGSMAWSPKRHRKNEVARLLGNNLSVTADIHLVVRGLWLRQFEDYKDQVENEELKFWKAPKEAGENQANQESENPFKSPPPGFPYRTRD